MTRLHSYITYSGGQIVKIWPDTIRGRLQHSAWIQRMLEARPWGRRSVSAWGWTIR